MKTWSAFAALILITGLTTGFAQVAIESVARPIPFSEPIDPDTYIIRPGERLRLTLLGTQRPVQEIVLDAEGRMVDPEVGVILLAGLSLSEAREQLVAVLADSYSGEGIAIGIAEPPRVSVTISGEVETPGSYRLWASQTVAEAIDSAGGFTANADQRWVAVTGARGVDTIDLLTSQRLERLNRNTYVYEVTAITAMAPRQVVTVAGDVRWPGRYSIGDHETVSDIVRLARPRSAGFLIQRNGEPADGSMQLAAFDRLTVVAGDAARAGITIAGAVAQPGLYDRSAATLGALLALAGGMTNDANRDRIVVWRPVDHVYAGVDEPPLRIPVQVGESGEDFALVAQDSVVVPRLLPVAEIRGLIAQPGWYPWRPGMSIAELIASGGGVASVSEPRLLHTDRLTGATRIVSASAIIADGDRIDVIERTGE